MIHFLHLTNFYIGNNRIIIKLSGGSPFRPLCIGPTVFFSAVVKRENYKQFCVVSREMMAPLLLLEQWMDHFMFGVEMKFQKQSKMLRQVSPFKPIIF